MYKLKNKFKYITLILLLACAPYEQVGEFKTILLENGDTIVEVSAAFGTHSHYNAEYSFVFKVIGHGHDTCEIIMLENGELLDLISISIDGPTDKTVWSDIVFHGSRVPDMDWSARLSN